MDPKHCLGPFDFDADLDPDPESTLEKCTVLYCTLVRFVRVYLCLFSTEFYCTVPWLGLLECTYVCSVLNFIVLYLG